MKSLLPLILSLFIVSAWAKIPVAQVVQLRGHVTQLKPGALEASAVVMGDQIVEDTSLVTAEKSFVRLKFVDGSLLNLGPGGKVVVVEMAKEGRGVVSLLKGTMRTQVEKNTSSKENKFFVKTRSAAMGVRGTDFETIYNPENKMTSLLTFKGEVAMANLKEGAPETKLKQVRVNKEDIEYEAKTQPKDLDTLLKDKEAVVVKPGQFSGTVQKMEAVSQPVKISPVQLNALYKNADFQAKPEGEVQDLKAETEKIAKESGLTQADQAAPPEGYFKPEAKEFAPKAGGFIDLQTGLYIPPHPESEFDPVRKIYIPQKVGSVDAKTGDYRPPEGLVLSASEGFVVSKEKAQDSNLLAMTESLNKNIAKDLVLAPEKYTETTLPLMAYSLREIYTKNLLLVSLVGKSESLDYTQTDGRLDRTMKSKSASGLRLEWLMSSDGVFQPLVDFSLSNMSYEEAGIAQNNKRLFEFAFGGRFYRSPRLNYMTKVALEQKPFVTYTTQGTNTSSTPELKAVMVPKLKMGLDYALIQGERWATLFDLNLSLLAPRQAGDLEVKMGAGLEASLSERYSFSERHHLQFAFLVGSESQKAHDSTLSATVKRQYSELSLSFLKIF